MKKNSLSLDPKLDASLESYIGSKKEGDTIELRLKARLVSVDDDIAVANIEEIIRLPEWKKSSDADEDTDDEIDVIEDDEDDSNPVVSVMGGADDE